MTTPARNPSRPARRRPRRGAALVEFAVISPVFFLLLFAVFEYTRLNLIRNTAQNAAYEAARRVIVPGAATAEATDGAAKILGTAGVEHFEVTLAPSVITESSPSVQVQVRVPFRENAWLTPLFAGDRAIVCSSTLRTERTRGP